MAKKKKEGIEHYNELYDYFKIHKDQYLMVDLACNDEVIIAVYLIGPDGKPKTVIETHPEMYEKQCVHYFKGVEVTRTELTIDENTIRELIRKLDLSPDIFKYPP